MGAKQTKETQNNTQTTTTAAAASPPPGHTRVFIHVYRPASSSFSVPGLGVYHSGVEAFDSEYFYGGNEFKTSGIVTQRPKTQTADSPWRYQETIDAGHTPCTRQQLRAILAEMASEWQANQYNVTTKNCNHFAAALCERLGVPFPSWINRAASVAAPFHRLAGQGNEEKAAGQADYDGPPVTEANKQALVHERVVNEELLTSGLIVAASVGALGLAPERPMSNITEAKHRFQAKYYIESDSDPQLLLFFPLSKPCKLVGLQFQFSSDFPSCQPAIVRVYVNQPNVDFDDCNDGRVAHTQKENIPMIKDMKEDPVGSLTVITRNPLTGPERKAHLVSVHVPLKSVHYQAVSFLTIFIESNHGADKTRIYGIDFFGRAADKK